MRLSTNFRKFYLREATRVFNVGLIWEIMNRDDELHKLEEELIEASGEKQYTREFPVPFLLEQILDELKKVNAKL